MGAPKSSGSLTAKATGTIEALPTALSCLDFMKRINSSGTMKVAPVPPNSPTSDMLKHKE